MWVPRCFYLGLKMGYLRVKSWTYSCVERGRVSCTDRILCPPSSGLILGDSFGGWPLAGSALMRSECFFIRLQTFPWDGLRQYLLTTGRDVPAAPEAKSLTIPSIQRFRTQIRRHHARQPAMASCHLGLGLHAVRPNHTQRLPATHSLARR